MLYTLFSLMDYAHRRRIKVWGRARVVEDDPALLVQLVEPHYKRHPEWAMVFDVEAWDANCSQHITPPGAAASAASEQRPPAEAGGGARRKGALNFLPILK
jgi:predicted pyridoxine 5'-phosphate oxidase superfamily flavin-nucleotide-binding protein